MRETDIKPLVDAPHCLVWPFPPGEECFTAWKKEISSIVDASVPAGPDRPLFDYHGYTWQLPQAFLHMSGGSAMAMSRAQRVIDDRPISQMALYLLTEGSVTGDYDGLTQNQEPGDIVAIDYSLPYECQTPRYEGLTITFDKSVAPAGLLNNHVHGVVLKANSSAGALLGSQIRLLADHVNGLSIDQAQAAVDGILRFAATAFPAAAAIDRRSNVSLYDRASQMARRKLSDPDFGPDELATALGISRSTLFRLFSAHGGVQRWQLTERLRASLRSIMESGGKLKISAIARQHGFRSDAHFSRAFQKRYQTSPSSALSVASTSKGAIQYTSWLDKSAKKERAMIEAWLESARG